MKKVTNGDIGERGLKFDIFKVTSFLNGPNANDLCNRMISERILKLQYVALRKLELCVFDFVNTSNYGRKTSLNILTKLNVTSGDYDETM